MLYFSHWCFKNKRKIVLLTYIYYIFGRRKQIILHRQFLLIFDLPSCLALCLLWVLQQATNCITSQVLGPRAPITRLSFFWFSQFPSFSGKKCPFDADPPQTNRFFTKFINSVLVVLPSPSGAWSVCLLRHVYLRVSAGVTRTQPGLRAHTLERIKHLHAQTVSRTSLALAHAARMTTLASCGVCSLTIPKLSYQFKMALRDKVICSLLSFMTLYKIRQHFFRFQLI